MSTLKGKIHHMATAIADVSVGAGAIVGGFGFAAAGAVVAAITSIAAVVTYLVSDQITRKTVEYKDAIPADTQKTWKRCGIGLFATFSLACGIGAWALEQTHSPKNDNHAAQTNQTTHKFNVEADPEAECILVVKQGQASTLSGSCTITPAAVQAPK